jgi:hypothetical protein
MHPPREKMRNKNKNKIGKALSGKQYNKERENMRRS